MFRKLFVTAVSVAVTIAPTMSAMPAKAAGVARIGNTYYEDTFTNLTCGSGQCTATSNVATPTDAYVRIRHVSCLLSAPTTSPLYAASIDIFTGPILSSGSRVIKSMNLSLGSPISSGSNYFFTVDSNPLYVVGAGKYVVFSASNTGGGIPNITGSCMISGDLIPLQQ